MAKKPEQISSHEHNVGYRRHLKKQATRLMRRAAKQNPGQAPTRRQLRGYSE